MLELVSELSESTTTDLLEKSELVTDLLDGGIPFIASIFVGYQELRSGLLPFPETRDNRFYELIGDQSDDYTNGDGNETENNGYTPFPARKRVNRKRSATDEDDQNLTTNNDALDSEEPSIPEDAFNDVELVIDPAGAADINLSI